MQDLSRFVMMFLIAVFGVAALFVASKSQEGMPYWAALAFFVFCILLLFKLIAVHGQHGGEAHRQEA
ncbi:MAG TPA: hypothetical protein VM659_26970 [Dongiaceae bacterium]|nr:hypothetical protein [Dongiaceae bacterium]